MRHGEVEKTAPIFQACEWQRWVLTWPLSSMSMAPVGMLRQVVQVPAARVLGQLTPPLLS